MGGVETSQIYLKELIFELDQLLVKYYEKNEMKKAIDSTIAPKTLIVLIIANYLMSGFFSFIWMGFIAFFFKIGFYSSLLALVFWIYSKYTKQYIEIIQSIDTICALIWDYVIL